jgi:hypothetical protein
MAAVSAEVARGELDEKVEEPMMMPLTCVVVGDLKSGKGGVVQLVGKGGVDASVMVKRLRSSWFVCHASFPDLHPEYLTRMFAVLSDIMDGGDGTLRVLSKFHALDLAACADFVEEADLEMHRRDPDKARVEAKFAALMLDYRLPPRTSNALVDSSCPPFDVVARLVGCTGSSDAKVSGRYIADTFNSNMDRVKDLQLSMTHAGLVSHDGDDPSARHRFDMFQYMRRTLEFAKQTLLAAAAQITTKVPAATLPSTIPARGEFA